jgi:hypothetical protein
MVIFTGKRHTPTSGEGATERSETRHHRVDTIVGSESLDAD